MVRDVLKYPHAQLQNQEVSQHQQQQKQLQQHELQQQQQLNADLGMMDLSYSNRSEHSHVADSRRQHPSPLTTPTDLHRNVLSSSHVSTPTPSLLDELRIQQESSRQTVRFTCFFPFRLGQFSLSKFLCHGLLFLELFFWVLPIPAAPATKSEPFWFVSGLIVSL